MRARVRVCYTFVFVFPFLAKIVLLMAPVACGMNCFPVFESSPAAFGLLRLFVIIGKQLDVNVKI
jgi:hypothetical protein